MRRYRVEIPFVRVEVVVVEVEASGPRQARIEALRQCAADAPVYDYIADVVVTDEHGEQAVFGANGERRDA